MTSGTHTGRGGPRPRHVAAGDTKAKAKKKYSVAVDARSIVLFLIAGAVAISAMILPGISGSFVLLLMGVYFDVLACINERNFALLGIFALGCLIGMAVFSRLINFALERFHDATLAFLSGLVLGSLYAIWPFKSFAVVAGQRVDKANILPVGFGGNEILTVGTVIAGAAIVGVFIWIEIKQEKRREQLKAEASS
jgi:putative membrane protein